MTRRFFVMRQPRSWWLDVGDHELRLRPHWSYILPTLGLALLDGTKLFKSSDCVVLLRGAGVLKPAMFEIRRIDDGRKLISFLDGSAGRTQADIADALRTGGFEVVQDERR
jgi:hypothetical protein